MLLIFFSYGVFRCALVVADFLKELCDLFYDVGDWLVFLADLSKEFGFWGCGVFILLHVAITGAI